MNDELGQRWDGSTHPAAIAWDQLKEHSKVTTTRRSGPGGQHRNKVETAVVIQHLPTGLIGQASERRSQSENLQEAIFRLRLKLALGLRLAPGDVAGPSPMWASRVHRQRIAVSDSHDDFPAILAEALDAVAQCELSMAAAAEKLQVTTSQLIKLLGQHPPALGLVNRARQTQGLAAIRRRP